MQRCACKKHGHLILKLRQMTDVCLWTAAKARQYFRWHMKNYFFILKNDAHLAIGDIYQLIRLSDVIRIPFHDSVYSGELFRISKGSLNTNRIILFDILSHKSYIFYWWGNFDEEFAPQIFDRNYFDVKIKQIPQ